MIGTERLVTAMLTVVLMAVGAPPGFAASRPPAADAGLPNVDRRSAAAASVPAQARDARRSLERSLGPLGDVRSAPASGAVSYVGRPTGLLTGPSPAEPREIAFDYVRDHGEVFGLSKGDFAKLRLVARSVSPDGITHLRFNQVLDGIQSLDSGLEAHITRDGRLINVSGAPLPGARLATPSPKLDATGGLLAARRAARGSAFAPRATKTAPGPERRTTFATGEQSTLRWAATPDGPRLAWNVISDGGDGHAYDVLVDAADGALLRRQDLTQHLGQARYFPRDPDHTPIQQITMPPAWYDDSLGGTRLWGQFSRTYVDPSSDQTPPAPGMEDGGTRRQIPASAGAPGSPDWLHAQSTTFPGAFPCPVSSPCTWDSAIPATATTNERQAAVNVHVLASRFHDHLAQAPIGFDEASGNFERTNSSGQGFDGDYVQSEVNDGSGLNNANFSTPPDGSPPQMQMYLWGSSTAGGFRDANGSDTADIVYHEYGHGFSNRLVVTAGGNSALTSAQSMMMGEAWSDFYGLDLLEGEGKITDTAAPAELKVGEYVVPGGIRAKPADCPVNAGGVTGCDRNGTLTTVLGGYTYGDLDVTENSSPHNGSEVWSQTLWDIRTAVGRPDALALITGGMRLSVDGPSMLDMRDAILQQAVAMRDGGGADHYATLWSVFAARGMGASATTPDADSTNPAEAFDGPTGLRAGATTITDPYPGGDNDGLAEPGERLQISQVIRGIGLVDLSPITGTLTGDPALTIEDGSAAWPALGRGRSAANADPLAVRLPRSAGCLTRRPVTIDVTSAEGPAQAVDIVDPRPASVTTVPLADAAGTPASPIPQTSTATFTVPAGGAITDVDLRIDELRHTWLGDLVVELSHNGVTVQIADAFGNANFDGDDILDAIFDDEAAGPPSTVAGPVTGRVRPSGSLSDFDGLPAAGTWTLKIIDNYPGDAGELRRWGLDSPQVGCTAVEIPAAATGAATGVTTAAATVTGTVTPNGRTTGLRFSYGTTTAYGASTPAQDVGAGAAAVERTAALASLAPATTYHFRAEAIRDNGAVAVAGEDRTFTTPAALGSPPPPGPPPPPPPPPPAPDTTRPAFLGSVNVTLGPGTVRGRKRPTFRFRLSEPASVTVTLTRAVRGVRKGPRCVAPKPRGKRCTRQLSAGTTTRAFTTAGAGVLRLSAAGLRKGTHTATLVATDAAKNRSLPRKARFTVR